MSARTLYPIRHRQLGIFLFCIPAALSKYSLSFHETSPWCKKSCSVGRVHPEVVASHSEVFFYLIFIYIFQYCHFSSFFYFVNCVTLCFCCFLLLPFRFSLKIFILHIFCSFSHIPPNVAIFENFENIFRLHFVSKDEEVGLYSIVQ